MTQNTEFTSFSRSDSTSGEEQSSHLAKARDELHVGLDIPKQAATEVYNWVQEQDWPKGTELEPLEDYHITMLFAQGDGAGAHKDAKWIKHDSHAVTLKGIKKFPPSDERDGLHPIVLLVKSDTIHGHHNALAEGALEAGVDPGPYSRGKFVPHMTVAYAPSLPEDLKLPELTFETAESSVSTPREETAEEESSREYKERHKDDDHEASVFSFVGLAAPEPPQVAPEGTEHESKQEPGSRPIHPWRIAQPRPPYMAELLKLADSWNPKAKYWHITHDPHFQIDPSRTPSDLSSMSMGADHEPALMFTDDPHGWASAFHSHPDELGVEYENTDPRLYAAEIEPYGQMGATNSEEGDYWPVNRGFGSEYYMPNPSPHVVRRVVPLTQALTEAEPSWNPKSATATGSPGLNEKQKKAEYHGDSWSPKTIWPNALRERNGEPVDADCTCQDGHKLDCPVHGMHPTLPTYDDTLEFPNPASPVGYDYHADGPRTWMRAETKVAQEISDEDFPFMREGCGDYAEALKEAHPALKFGMNYNHVVDEDGDEVLEPVHAFAHDDTHAYDALGKHPLPYNPFNADHTEYDVHPDDIAAAEFVQESGEEEPHEHIQRRHPYFAKAKKKLWLDDTRRPPDKDWDWACNVAEAQHLLQEENREYDEMSLDHDLSMVRYEGKAVINPDALSGGDFCLWLHEHGDKKHMPKKVTLHTHNHAALEVMYKALEPHTEVKIERAPDHLEEDWAREFKVHEPSEIEKEEIHLPERVGSHQLAWLPGSHIKGKGLVTPSGDVHTWPVDKNGAPHHAQYVDTHVPYQPGEGQAHFFKITPRGRLDTESYAVPPQVIHHILKTLPGLRAGEHTDWHFGGPWGMRGTVYHVAPTAERNRILQHGLQPADPLQNTIDYDWMPEHYDAARQPFAVYGYPSRAKADAHRHWIENKRRTPHDVWEIPGDYNWEIDPDDPESAIAIRQPVLNAQMVEGPEHRLGDPDDNPVYKSEKWQRQREAWHFGADKADTREYQDFRMMPPMTQPPNATNPHPEKQGCTCDEGEKLTCPVHGLHPDPDQQGYDHSWSIPQNAPVGYPQDQPKNYFVNTGAVSDGDGYVECAQGHQHWGVNGAAGLMLRHVDEQGQPRYLLTHRSPAVQHGSTYSVPGGALDSHEYPEEGALREAQEELGPIPGFHPTGVETADHGGWAYHTVHGDVDHMFEPQPQNWETNSAQWFTPHEIDQLPLHPGFRSYWEGRGRTSAWRMVDVSGDQGGEQHDAKANSEAKQYVPEQRADDRRKANQDESSRVDVHDPSVADCECPVCKAGRDGGWAMTGLPRAEGAVEDEAEHEDNLEGNDVAVPAPPEAIKRKQRKQKDRELVEGR